MVDQPDNYLSQLVGEGKKYSSPEELAKAYVNADSFIENLKRENSEIREDLGKAMDLKELLTKKQVSPTENKESQPSSQNDVPKEDQQEAQSATNPPVKDTGDKKELDLSEEIRKALRQEQDTQRANRNREDVANRLQEIYGDADKAATAIQAKAKELELGADFLNDLASKSPMAFYSALGLNDSVKSVPSPSRGSVNTAALEATNPNKLPEDQRYSYYQKMRRDNPSAYHTTKTQNRIYELASALGDAFYNS